jgi:hypothetical protein
MTTPFEAPDESYRLNIVAQEDSSDSILLTGVGQMIGNLNNNFSFATNQCYFLNSKPEIGYYLFKIKQLILPIIIVIGISIKFNLPVLTYFFWPSVFYYFIQPNPDTITIAIASMVLVLPLPISGAAFFIDTLLLDRSAICSFLFVIIYILCQKVPESKIKSLIFVTIILAATLETFRFIFSSQLVFLTAILSQGQDTLVESIVTGTKDFGQNSIIQILSLISSLFFLGGRASFYPTPIFYIVFGKFIWNWSRKLKQLDLHVYEERKRNLYIALISLTIAFFSIRILLPSVGNGRYWLVIVPFILNFIGADREYSQRGIIKGLIVLTIIANSWMYFVWLSTC